VFAAANEDRDMDRLICGAGALAPAALSVIAVLAPLPTRACATCGCTADSDAAMGYSSESGWRVNLEYVYIDQDQLRSGTHSATPAEVVNQPFDPALNGGEIEQQTINRYLNLGLAYRPDANWNFGLIAPVVLRSHSTYGVQTEPYTPAETAPDQLSYVNLSRLGDIKLLAAWQGLLPTHNLGLQLGVKLPTGPYGTAMNFQTGPNAGTPLDASLQPGTGSTDLILGAYYFQPISQDFDAFATANFQTAVAHQQNQPGADFRPGNSLTASFGVRYEAHPRWVPQLQVNLYDKRADQGALADVLDTAGFVAYLSPGLTVRLVHRLQLYGILQIPVYSNLGGYQLFPHWAGTIGFSYGT
jgi:hypothetical protein